MTLDPFRLRTCPQKPLGPTESKDVALAYEALAWEARFAPENEEASRYSARS